VEARHEPVVEHQVVARVRSDAEELAVEHHRAARRLARLALHHELEARDGHAVAL
jgi:hypothetical protein